MTADPTKEEFIIEFFEKIGKDLPEQEKQILDKLTQEIILMSEQVPPQNKTYTFREILMLATLNFEKKIQERKNNFKIA